MARAQPGSARRYLQPRATLLRRNSSAHAAPAQVRGMVHSCIGKAPAPAAAATPVAGVARSARLNDLLRNLGTSGPPSLSSRCEGEWLEIYFYLPPCDPLPHHTHRRSQKKHTFYYVGYAKPGTLVQLVPLFTIVDACT